MYTNLSIHDERPGTEVQAADGALLFHESNEEWVVDEHLQHLTCTNTHTPKHTHIVQHRHASSVCTSMMSYTLAYSVHTMSKYTSIHIVPAIIFRMR